MMANLITSSDGTERKILTKTAKVNEKVILYSVMYIFNIGSV